jgi:catechol 2,3-dioxygenase-like lactoylglutathione lyase family enzyme
MHMDGVRESQPMVTIDHMVVVAKDVWATVSFYERVLGAKARDLDAWEAGQAEYPVLHFGGWKINVHPADTDATPRANQPIPGSVDLCLQWSGPIDAAQAHLGSLDVPIELGPVDQEGAAGWGRSVYFRDPDGCLLELISYQSQEPEV